MFKEIENLRFGFFMSRYDVGGIARIDSSLRTTVEKGSKFRKYPTPSLNKSYVRYRAALVSNGILTLVGNTYVLTRDFPFTNPSIAACLIEGGSRNGYESWRAFTNEGFKSLCDFGIRRFCR